MKLLVYVVGFCILAVAAYTFRATFRKTWRKLSPPPRQLPIPEIPAELPTKPEPPKVFLDPLLMQVYGPQTELLPIINKDGRVLSLLVNSSAANIFYEQGWTPFRETVRLWTDSVGYCRFSIRGQDRQGELMDFGELSIAYLFAEQFGGGDFDQAFTEMEQFWLEYATEFGFENPKPKT